MILSDPRTHAEWLACRKSGIGGSDAASVLGLNPYKSNIELYREKAGIATPADISDNPAVRFGKEAEAHIRALFQLNHPEYNLDYHEFRMYAQPDTPYLYATLDGELTTGNRYGILEIKTTTIQQNRQWDDWTDRIPEHYYVQILHQLQCTGWDFVVLVAFIRYRKGDGWAAAMREYYIERSEVEHEITYLKEKEVQFWRRVTDHEEPPLILPRI
ncbi:MAG: recombinase [Ruminococcus sp.]|nr:recombinase [Ruminococcus sp.]